MVRTPEIGVVSLQGGVEEHLAVLDTLGIKSRRVRLPRDLEGLDGLILPGGESTTIDKLARAFGLDHPLRECGLPILATCAGLIYCAKELENPVSNQHTLGLIDVTVRRNAFGNQRFSQECVVDVDGISVDASFIRAPIVTRVGAGVEVIATVPTAMPSIALKDTVVGGAEEPVVVGVRQDGVTALSFHPEENGDVRVHEAWLRKALILP